MKKEKPPRRLVPLDYLAIIGALINIAVIGLIIGYWVTSVYG